MDKKSKQIIITAVLVTVMVAVWVNSFKILIKRSKAKRLYQTSAATTHVSSYSLPASTEEVLISLRVFKDENLDWKRCPFSGHNYNQQETVEDLAISGIIWDEFNPKTIINGEILSEGESIGGFIIEKIEKQKVTLSDGTKTLELHI